MILIREDQTYPDLRVHHMVRAASLFYPDWDAGLAATLLEAYELPATRPAKKLSRGMRTALGIVIGLAARADVTLFDEAAELLERVLVIDHGRVVLDAAAHTTAVMAGRLDERDRELADHLALRLDRRTLQQLAIYAAGSHDRLDLTERETAR